jgi:hypothetical protein
VRVGKELKRHAAISSFLACCSFSLLLLHCPQPAHSDELPLAGGRRHSALVALRRLGSLWLTLGVSMEAFSSLWSCSCAFLELGTEKNRVLGNFDGEGSFRGPLRR